jgi:hypothetical protein
MTIGIAAVGGAVGTSDVSAVSGASYGSPQQKATSLYNSIDTSGSGSITQQQFDQAFQTQNPPAVFQQQGADAIFAALDPNGSGSVSKQDFIGGLSQLMVSLRADGGQSNAPGPSPSQTLSSSTTLLNAIGNGQPGSVVNTTA